MKNRQKGLITAVMIAAMAIFSAVVVTHEAACNKSPTACQK